MEVSFGILINLASNLQMSLERSSMFTMIVSIKTQTFSIYEKDLAPCFHDLQSSCLLFG